MDKSFILNSIKKEYGFKNDGDFANFLGIKLNSYSTWKKRNSIDYDLIIAKCTNLNGHFLLTGEGNITLNKKNEEDKCGDPSLDYLNLKVNELSKTLNKVLDVVVHLSVELDEMRGNSGTTVANSSAPKKGQKMDNRHNNK